MCLKTALLSVFFFSLATTFLVRAKTKEDAAAPLISGSICALIIIPAAILIGDKVAWLGLILIVTIAAVMGDWSIKGHVMTLIKATILRVIFSLIGFGLFALLVVFLNRTASISPLYFFLELISETLEIVGLGCVGEA